jgi:hypothetical protein
MLTEKARREAENCLRIAAADKKNVQAQVVLLNLAFKNHELQDALTYAENLLDSNIEQDDEMVKKYPTELAAAHFLKARAALRADPPRPDEVLNHVKACMDLKKRAPARDEKERWREIDLEARALQLKAKEAKTHALGGKGVKDDSMAILLQKVPEWIERAQEEKKKIAVSGDDNTPDQSIIVLSNPTNLEGLFSFLTLSIELSPTPEAVADRANLILDLCDVLIAGKRLSSKSLDVVNDQLKLLPATLKKSEKFAGLPQESRDKVKQRIEKMTDKNKQAGALMDPAIYALLAQDACDECRWEAAESQAYEGLRLADARKLAATDPAVVDLHESAARVLLVKKNHMTPKNIS